MQFAYQGCGMQVQRDYKPILEHKQCVVCGCGLDVDCSQNSAPVVPPSPTPSTGSRMSECSNVQTAPRELFPQFVSPFTGGIPCTLWKGVVYFVVSQFVCLIQAQLTTTLLFVPMPN
jgi:hypothetical protein